MDFKCNGQHAANYFDRNRLKYSGEHCFCYVTIDGAMNNPSADDGGGVGADRQVTLPIPSVPDLGGHEVGDHHTPSPSGVLSAQGTPTALRMLLCERLQPQQLRTVMHRTLDYDEALEKDFKSFAKMTCREEIACQSYAATHPPPDTQRPTSRSTPSPTTSSNPRFASDTSSRG